MQVRIFCLPLAVLTLCSYGFCQAANSAEELKLGAEAYKLNKQADAIEHFRKAVAFDDQNIKAHLYLATALAQEYIPGVDEPDNKQFGESAISEYQAALVINPKETNAVKGIAYLKFQMKQFGEAKEYYNKAAELDPNDPEMYYTVGVIDWTESYQARMERRAKLGLSPDKLLIQHNECWEVRSLNEDRVKDGMEKLAQAMNLRPNYDDAMAYMNLMYRERADIQCSDPAANVADLKQADKWVDLAIDSKKQKVEKARAAQANSSSAR